MLVGRVGGNADALWKLAEAIGMSLTTIAMVRHRHGRYENSRFKNFRIGPSFLNRIKSDVQPIRIESLSFAGLYISPNTFENGPTAPIFITVHLFTLCTAAVQAYCI